MRKCSSFEGKKGSIYRSSIPFRPLDAHQAVGVLARKKFKKHEYARAFCILDGLDSVFDFFG